MRPCVSVKGTNGIPAQACTEYQMRSNFESILNEQTAHTAPPIRVLAAALQEPIQIPQ